MSVLKEYNDNPTNPSVLLNIAQTLHNDNLHEAAMLFVENLQKITSDPSMIRMSNAIAGISGYYSAVPARRQLAKVACEQLSLDINCDEYLKNFARKNSIYYVDPLHSFMPSLFVRQVDFIPDKPFNPTNPSITNYNGELWMIQRTVSYRITDAGTYDMQGFHNLVTRNYILKLDENLNVLSSQEILAPIDWPAPADDRFIGFEDCRLFSWQGQLYCSGTLWELNSDGYCDIVVARIDGIGTDKCRFADYTVVRPSFGNRQLEKNWMPFVIDEKLYFVYSCYPVKITDINGTLVSNTTPSIASDAFKGGGQLLYFNGGWLAIIHESHDMYDSKRRYTHRFVWFDCYGNLKKISPRFYFKDVCIEFAAGMAMHPDGNRVVISFGMHDSESWLATVTMNDIMNSLQEITSNDSQSFDNIESDQTSSEHYSQISKDNLSKFLQDIANLANTDKHNEVIEQCLSLINHPIPDDIKRQLLSRIAVSGYWTNNDQYQSLGKNACEELSFDRNAQIIEREFARQTGAFYASVAATFMPSISFTEIKFDLPKNRWIFNPSIATYDDKIYMIQRSFNSGPKGAPNLHGDTSIRTTNYFICLSNELEILSVDEILMPRYLPPPKNEYIRGFEDCRLFFLDGEAYCSFTVCEMHESSCARIGTARIQGFNNKTSYRFTDVNIIEPNFVPFQNEKNWMPWVVDDTVSFIYKCDPTQVIDTFGNLKNEQECKIAAENFRGGSQLLEFDGGYLALIHANILMPWKERRYLHRFVWFDINGNMTKCSPSFYFKVQAEEFVAGIAVHPVTDKILISFGIESESSWIATVDKDEIRSILNHI
jgi:predicted GH43/DUF377 family glycosyl hydrolase